MPTPLLECRALSRRHPNGKDFLLRDVCLAIDPGERAAIVGPSGAGKTLLLRSLAMLDPIDGGEILWHGQVVRAAAVPQFRSHVMYLHQRPGLFDGTVEDNLRMPYRLATHSAKAFDRDWTIGHLRKLGRSANFLDQSTKSLSGGESQLVAALRAIQLGPEVLLFDEPTASLDNETSNAVEQLAAEWFEADSQRALVWVSHNHDQAHRVTDHVFHMAVGQLVASETADVPTSPHLG